MGGPLHRRRVNSGAQAVYFPATSTAAAIYNGSEYFELKANNLDFMDD